MRKRLPILLGVLTSMFFAMPLRAQVLIWDNDQGEHGTAMVHRDNPRWNTFDDFWFAQPVILTSYRMLFFWMDGSIDSGDRVELTLWNDQGGNVGSGGEPHSPHLPFVLQRYSESPTGSSAFGRPVLDVRQDVAPTALEPGVWWLEMFAVPMEGLAEDGGAQLMTQVQGQQGWIFLEDVGGLQPGEPIFGFESDFNFQLFGFIPGEANPGFMREIVPRIFSGIPVGTVDDISESDDLYYEVSAGEGFRVSRAHSATVEFHTTLPDFAIDALDITVESTVDRGGVHQEVALFDFDAGQWVILDDRPVPLNIDTRFTLADLADPNRFIDDDTNDVKVRIEAYAPSIFLRPPTLGVDELTFTVVYSEL